MTTIVMVEKPDGVQIAWDSKVSWGYSHQEIEQEKVFEASGITYGVAGLVRVSNVLEEMDVKPPSPNLSNRETDSWVTRVLIPRMQNAMRVVDNNAVFDNESNILVVVNARVYNIGADFSRIRNTSGIYSIGSGSHFATGALSNGATAQRAVEIASMNDMATGHSIKTKFISS